MFDVKAIRDDPAAYARGWSLRGLDGQATVDGVLAADVTLRSAQTAFQTAQTRRNEASRLIGAAKKAGDEARAAELMAEVEALKGEIARSSEAEKAASEALRETLAAIPNIPAEDVPEGADEHGNVEIRRVGEPSALPAGRLNAPSDHVALGEALGMMDFEAAARMSGARFVVLRRDLARLERALGQFMLDLQTREHGYEEVSPPIIVRTEAMFGTGQFPKFYDDQFLTTPGFEALNSYARDFGRTAMEGLLNQQPGLSWQDANADDAIDRVLLTHEPRRTKRAEQELDQARWLIPTAEVSLTNLIREQIMAEEQLPLRLTALTPCFRSEAGASGRDTRGMIRQHQFYKCELVSIATPEQSAAEHERMVECAEVVLKKLELPFRTMLLCTGDMGFSAKKTYDLEVWLPSQGTYREISSCSNCGDFQARRMDARIKTSGEKGTRFPHTLNGSGLAVGRTLVAVMENYQDEAGRISIPEALQPYMGGMTHIGPTHE